MELAQHEEPASALQRKTAKLHQKPDLGTPSNKKLRGLLVRSEGKNRAAKSRKRGAPEQQQQQQPESQHCEEIGREEGGEESDRTEIEGKIAALQRIVPGGEELGVDKLFEETAEYILTLQWQVKSMRAMTSFFEGLERNKRKLGG